MTYCALLIPHDKAKEQEKDVSFIQSLGGKLMSGVTTGNLSFENATTVLKNVANVISENTDTLANKFSGVALTQLLVDGKITNETAFNYLTQGFPKALGMTSVAMGFQSVEQLKNALKNKNGVNVQQFLSSFQNFGGALSDFMGLNENRRNVEGFDVVEIDAVLSDERQYSAETPDRRVESGQTYQEFIHNLPDLLTLECVLQDGRRYTTDEFEDVLLNLRKRKVAVNIILGDVTKENYVLTNFSPHRATSAGFEYTLEFKKIQVGSVDLVSLDISDLVPTGTIVTNTLFGGDSGDDKTVTETSNGWKEGLDLTKNSILDTAKSAAKLVTGAWW